MTYVNYSIVIMNIFLKEQRNSFTSMLNILHSALCECIQYQSIHARKTRELKIKMFRTYRKACYVSNNVKTVQKKISVMHVFTRKKSYYRPPSANFKQLIKKKKRPRDVVQSLFIVHYGRV